MGQRWPYQSKSSGKEEVMAAIPPKADTSWIKGFREKYETWFREAKPLIEAHQYPAAFKSYPFPSFLQIPWAPMRIPLSKARVGMVSTAALYRKGKDEPFADTVEGDPRVIEISSDVNPVELDTAHTHIPPEAIRADVNVALPLNPLLALAAEKRIRQVAPRIFSILGYRTRADEVAMDTAPVIAAAMAEDKVSLALIVPV
jgi:D-proline reductase (dithiol) PrdB